MLPSGLKLSFQRNMIRVRHESGLPLVFGGAVGPSRHLVLTEFAGTVVGPLRGLVLGQGRGVGGKSLATARAVRVTDYVNDGRISHDYDATIQAEHLRAMVAVPVVVHRGVRGVVYGATRDAVPIGDRTIAALVDAARELGQDIAVWDRIRESAAAAEHPAQIERHPDESSRRWEDVREAFAELRVLSRTVRDPAARERIDAVCDTLIAAAATEPPKSSVTALSAREVDVLACAAMGQTSGEIAADLGLRPETVKSYLKSAMRKLNAHSRLEAVTLARRIGALP